MIHPCNGSECEPHALLRVLLRLKDHLLDLHIIAIIGFQPSHQSFRTIYKGSPRDPSAPSHLFADGGRHIAMERRRPETAGARGRAEECGSGNLSIIGAMRGP